MSYKLYLDDRRNPKASYDKTKNKIYLEDWVVVRNYNEFVAMITSGGIPEIISFDHDLAEEHLIYFFENGGHKNPPDPLNVNFSEKTGYDCALWLLDLCEAHNMKFPDFLIHSANPIGSSNISNLILTRTSFES